MAVASTSDVLAQVRSAHGPRLVTSREEAEQHARELLVAGAGALTAEDVLELGEAFNRHEKASAVRRDRFSPAFVGASVKRLIGHLDALNVALVQLWRTTDEDTALDQLGTMLGDRSLVPWAGSSLPSMLLYLRDPDRFGVFIWSTMNDLRVALGNGNTLAPAYRFTSRAEYERFCADLTAWRAEYDIAPQEADLVLTELFRESRRVNLDDKDDVLPPPPDDAAPGGLPASSAERLSVEDVADRCLLSADDVERWVKSLTAGRLQQAFFHGPPGTGKTHIASALARHLASSPSHVEIVQFHPAYSYEDFVEGLRPDVGTGGMLSYSVRAGLFSNLCRRAAEAPDERFVLIIDEMNRADLAAVFGELLYLLEYRGRQVRLPYSQKAFSVPSNLILLGTMNTADRSLALIDFALRRRFHAFELRPDGGVLAAWMARHGVADDLAVQVFSLVTDRVGTASPATPGHAFWMGPADPDSLSRVWSHQVRPYLMELWYDDPSAVDQLDEDVMALLADGA